jgi:hypothetical protein
MDRNVNAECKEEPADDNHMDHHASANAHDTEDFQLALIPPRSLSKSMREARSMGGIVMIKQVFPVLLGLCMNLDESTIGAVIGLRLERICIVLTWLLQPARQVAKADHSLATYAGNTKFPSTYIYIYLILVRTAPFSFLYTSSTTNNSISS